VTKDEALDLALRSLKELVPDESDYAPAIQGQRKRQEKAITAIKQARSAPVQDVSLIDEGKTVAPVQEPVALTDDEIWKFWWNKPEVPEGEDDSMEAQFVFACREAIKAATQRQWVELTPEKIDELMYRFTGYELLYAIQAELKENNT
jgi:hypothetical protein